MSLPRRLNTLVRLGYDTYSNRHRMSESLKALSKVEVIQLLVSGGEEVWGESQKKDLITQVLVVAIVSMVTLFTSANYRYKDFGVDAV